MNILYLLFTTWKNVRIEYIHDCNDGKWKTTIAFLIQPDSNCKFTTKEFIYAIGGRIESYEGEVSNIEYQHKI